MHSNSVASSWPEKPQERVIVVGAGPCGLLSAIRIGQAGIPVTVLEAAPGLDQRPRATHYSSPAVLELIKAGVFEDVKREGFHPQVVTWRKADGKELAHMPMSSTEPGYPYPMVCLPINRLGAVILEHVKSCPDIEILWGHKAVKVGQDEQAAWLEVEHDGGKKTLKAAWVIGTDGASSMVRRDLGLTFDGMSWDKQLVATNVYYPFDTKFGWTDSNFIINPEDWYMAAKISTDGMWRVTYGEVGGLTEKELLDRQPSKFKKMLPGAPKPGDYQLSSISPYKIHQRRANTFRKGRFLLAGDAAHICSPFGGLGLTGGIVDAGNLSDALIGVIKGVADESILDKYSEIRIKAFDEIVNPFSTENLLRASEQTPETTMLHDKFLTMLASSEDDPQKLNFLHDKVMEIQHDFTQYYHGSL